MRTENRFVRVIASKLRRLEPHSMFLLLRLSEHFLKTFLAADAGPLAAAE